MKSRAFVLATLVALGIGPAASAQVFPIGRAPVQGGVQPASCSTCGPAPTGFYDGVVWGGNCMDCRVKHGLFPPCPNPCRTTLLGELVFDVKTAVDTGLSTLFSNLLGPSGFPCGCQDVCSCAEPACGMAAGCDCGGDMGTVISEPMMMQPTPASPAPAVADPFGDDPQPTPATPSASARRSIMTTPPRAAQPVRRNVSRRPTAVRPISHEQPIVERPEPHRISVSGVSVEAAPLQAEAASEAAEHYQPRRTTSLRRISGAELKRAPVRAHGSTPSLRFREADER